MAVLILTVVAVKLLDGDATIALFTVPLGVTPVSYTHLDVYKRQDIAHALSLMTRANGHFPVFYSVAQHSLDCAAMAQAEGRSSREVLACLLHDASEAYLSDITRPVKGCLPEYRRIEQVLQEMIYEKYLIAPPTEREREIVKRMDDTCLYYEFEHFTGEKLFDVAPQAAVLPEYRECPMREVEKKFLALFEKLMAQTVQEHGVRTDQ